MKKDKIAIVLGGTSPHIELINNLKRRGFYTVLIDYYKNPPAKEFADKHVQESTMDFDKVVEIAVSENADLIISACIDRANISACYASEILGLPVPYSYKTALEISNKEVMKSMMIENGLPTSKYISTDDASDYKKADLNFPVVVKPVDSYASNGVKKVYTIEELEEHFSFAKEISSTGKVIIEEVVSGVEISAYCFVKNGKAEVLMMSERLSEISEEKDVIKCYATLTPADISTTAAEKVEESATKIAELFNLQNTPLHLQAFVDGDEINIIEFAPRVGGGLSYKTVRERTGFDLIDASIDSYLGSIEDYNIFESESNYAIIIIYAFNGVLKEIKGINSLLESGVIEDFFPYKSEGMKIKDTTASKSRVGAFIVKGCDEEELKNKIKTAVNRIDVIGTNEESIYNKNIYEKLSSN